MNYSPFGLLGEKNLTVYYNEVKTVMLENITLVKIYKKKGLFKNLPNTLFGNKYVFVIFLNNEKQIEFSLSEKKLNLALKLKNEIVKRKLILSE